MKDCDFEIEIITYTTKFIFISINFVKYDKLFQVLIYL